MVPGRLEYLMLSAPRNNTPLSIEKPSLRAWLLLFSGSFFLNGCFAPIAALGTSSTAAVSSAGTAVGSAAAAYPATAASLATTAATGKSPLEHATSAATKKDCSFFNVLSSQPICQDILMPSITDKSELYLGPADAPDYKIEVK